MKEKQQKGEELARSCTGAFTKIWGLPCAHLIEKICLEDIAIPLRDVDQHWQLYRPWPTRSDSADAQWEDLPKDLPQSRHFHYVGRERTPSFRTYASARQVENQRLANIDRIDSTPPLEVDSDHDFEAIPFQPRSVTPQ